MLSPDAAGGGNGALLDTLQGKIHYNKQYRTVKSNDSNFMDGTDKYMFNSFVFKRVLMGQSSG